MCSKMKKTMAVLLALIMVLGASPISGVFADEADPQGTVDMEEVTDLQETAELQQPYNTQQPDDTQQAEESQQADDTQQAEEPQQMTDISDIPDAVWDVTNGGVFEEEAAEVPEEEMLLTADSKEIYIWTPGHGTVKVNGSDYGTECRGTWPEGTEVSIEAVPAEGYKFARWLIWNWSGNPSLIHTAPTTVTAGSDFEAAAGFGLEKASITVTLPAAGSSGSGSTPVVSVPSGAGYSVTQAMWVGQNSTLDSLALITPNTFEAGETYYMYVALKEGTDQFASAGGGAAFETELDVNGGRKTAQRNLQFQVGVGIEAIISVTIPADNTHTVTFDAQGGTPVPAAQTVVDGGKATKPADNPIKDGLYFLGWFEKPGAELTRDEVHSGGFKFADTPITEDKTLYAVWYAGFYGATYDLSAATPKYAATGGDTTFTSTYQQKSSPSKVWWNYSIVQGSQVTITAIPASGARFVGWAPTTLNADDNCPDTPPSRDEIVSMDNPYTFTFEGKTALAALFEKGTVTVTFDAQGGTPVPDAQTVTYGGKATAPADPEKAPWGFRGWYTDTTYEEMFNFNTSITEDKTLYAGWVKSIVLMAYDLTNNQAGGGGIGINDGEPTNELIVKQIFEGQTNTLIAAPDDRHEFVGWSSSASESDIVSTAPEYSFETASDSGDLWALFREKPPTITLHWSSIDGVDLVKAIPITVAKGTTVTQALNQYREGTTIATELFAKDGYKDWGYRVTKPLTEYAAAADPWNALWTDDIARDSVDTPVPIADTLQINEDMDIYYVMFREIDSAAVTAKAPACGVETTTDKKEMPWGEEWDWGSQTNSPGITVPGGVNYQLDLAVWDEDDSRSAPFIGTFSGGSTYTAEIWLAADFGYAFACDDPEAYSGTATVNGGTVVRTLYDGEYLGIVAEIIAVHDPGAPVKETISVPTCEKDGAHDEVIKCKACEKEISRKKVTDKKLGHSWDSGKVTKKASFTEAGVVTYTCKNDKTHTRTEAIPILTVSDPVDKTYNGKAQTQTLTVKSGSTTLKAGTDYTVSYSNNIQAGTATVTVTAKGSRYTGSISKSFKITAALKAHVSYTSHLRTTGWESGWKKDGEQSGTTGQSRRLEAVRINIDGGGLSGSVQYQSHVRTYGWQKDWTNAGNISGTTGESRRMEAIRIRLTGELADTYDIYYRVHVRSLGWMGWAKNGESAGTAGEARRMEAIQIELVKKGGAAPGSTANAFRQK